MSSRKMLEQLIFIRQAICSVCSEEAQLNVSSFQPYLGLREEEAWCWPLRVHSQSSPSAFEEVTLVWSELGFESTQGQCARGSV